jgi:uncharacterized protein (TIGR03437 family)
MLIRTLSLLLFLRLGFTTGPAFAAPAATFPVLTYSTYLRDSFTPKAIATDSSGNIYLAGNAIVDPGTLQSTVLVVKLNPQASQYVYVRYLGGSVNDSASAIAVDAAGNAYVAGSTTSPDFPVTSGSMGTAPTSASDQRSFVAKLDAGGNFVFSDLLGGSAISSAQAVAVNAAGQVVVTGMVSYLTGPPFPSTAGAYNIANTANHPYLLELDPTGTKIVFSATGIGGSALAVDSTGDIYMSGTTYLLDYPTTPGAYQSTFPAFDTCFSPPCAFESQGGNQYVTKVDPTGSKLIFSTAVSGTGNTINQGLAVDTAGNVYLTGYSGPPYPYTGSPPSGGNPGGFPFTAFPFLSKLDPSGRTLQFSVPVGGAGVQAGANGSSISSSGTVFTGGGIGPVPLGDFAVPANIPGLENIPTQCFPGGFTPSSAYVAQVDAASGNLLGSQFIQGSTLTASGIALGSGPSTVWIAGATSLPDIPFTANALTIPDLGPTPGPGAYLGAVDFSQPEPPARTPQIGCIVDSASLAPDGLGVPYQLLTILGTGLGPTIGASAADSSTTTLDGVNISVGFVSAPLLYVSSTQINFAVPLVSQSPAPMQLTVNGLSAPPRALPLTFANPSLFLNTTQSTSFGPVALALNGDGSVNSSTNPAQLGSTVSVFVNGLTPDPQFNNAPLQLFTNNGWSVIDIVQANLFVVRVDLRVPSPLVNNFACSTTSICMVDFTLSDINSNVSPGQAVSSIGGPFGGVVYINRAQ